MAREHSSQALNDEFVRGYNAGSHGGDASDCRHPDGPLRDAWLAGLAAAEQVTRHRDALNRLLDRAAEGGREYGRRFPKPPTLVGPFDNRGPAWMTSEWGHGQSERL